MIKLISSSFETQSPPEFRFVNHDWFIAFQIKGKDTTPYVSFYIKNYQEVISLKNNFLSAFNKVMKEAGYDK